MVAYIHIPFTLLINIWCLKMTHTFISSCAITYVISLCAMKAYRGRNGMAVLFLNLDTRWR